MIRLGELHIATTELSFSEYPVQIWDESRQFKSLAVSVVVVSKNQNWLIYYFDKARSAVLYRTQSQKEDHFIWRIDASVLKNC